MPNPANSWDCFYHINWLQPPDFWSINSYDSTYSQPKNNMTMKNPPISYSKMPIFHYCHISFQGSCHSLFHPNLPLLKSSAIFLELTTLRQTNLGGKLFVIFTFNLGRWSNLTSAYFSDGWETTTNQNFFCFYWSGLAMLPLSLAGEPFKIIKAHGLNNSSGAAKMTRSEEMREITFSGRNEPCEKKGPPWFFRGFVGDELLPQVFFWDYFINFMK